VIRRAAQMKKLLSLTAFGFLLLVSVILCGWTSTARGEPFIDLYSAAAILQYSKVKDKSSAAPLRLTIEDGHFDTSFSIGGRIGWWFGGAPEDDTAAPVMGVALDAFHFRPNFDRQVREFTEDGTSGRRVFEKIDFDVKVIGLSLMARGPIAVTPDFPHGQTQLYFGIGPGAFITTVKDRGNFAPSGQKESVISPGLDLKGGLKLFITKSLAIFGEYRFTMHSPEVKFRDGGNRERLSTTLNAHHLGGGISLHFFVP